MAVLDSARSEPHWNSKDSGKEAIAASSHIDFVFEFFLWVFASVTALLASFGSMAGGKAKKESDPPVSGRQDSKKKSQPPLSRTNSKKQSSSNALAVAEPSPVFEETKLQ